MKMESVSLNPNNMDSAAVLNRPEMQPLKTSEPEGSVNNQQPVASESAPVTEQQSKELANILQGQADSMDRNIEFSTYGEGKKTVIKVTEQETGKLIREIPPEEQQKLYSQIHEFLGTIVNTFT